MSFFFLSFVRFPELHVDSIVVPGKTESKMIRIRIMTLEERQQIALEKLNVVKVFKINMFFVFIYKKREKLKRQLDFDELLNC